jgi:hypothetical protein
MFLTRYKRVEKAFHRHVNYEADVELRWEMRQKNEYIKTCRG